MTAPICDYHKRPLRQSDFPDEKRPGEIRWHCTKKAAPGYPGFGKGQGFCEFVAFTPDPNYQPPAAPAPAPVPTPAPVPSTSTAPTPALQLAELRLRAAMAAVNAAAIRLQGSEGSLEQVAARIYHQILMRAWSGSLADPDNPNADIPF